ncbi:MAG: hypothetical protein HY245_14410 [Rhizobiales bacterium]|nr:hypothetical protein [Hyphomicrobiales bacterium]MBI3674585.1 hypothetical protein [Hyphomicrobiales bacterium]
MKKFAAIALAASLGLASLVPAEAATMAKKPGTHTKTTAVCHMAKGKDGKMHKFCHHAKHMTAKKKK